ncbi:MAG: response regulator [Deltaproteobacteria bacterium]|nr:response regulator [Deltaproteobacteria bacterium]
MPKRIRKAVMIVEHDSKRRKELYEVLRLTRVDVFSAVDSEAAMETVRREQPELILLNMYSRETNGIEFLKQLRCFGLGQKMIVLGMAGDEDPEIQRAASLAGADKLLERKPAPHLVLELVAAYLGIQKIEVPTRMVKEVGTREVKAAPREALDADVLEGDTKPIIKSIGTLLRLTDGRRR